jgi:nucleoside-diphosphate-sugar epimerase
MKVLVTGGSGFLGTRLQMHQPDWVYVSSKDCDLTNPQETERFFSMVAPDAIVHLAARVGGIKENINNQASFYYENTLINTNVIQCAYKAGVTRVLSSLSTCAYPDRLCHYPFTEDDFFRGTPAETNFAYGITKRGLQVQSCAYREQYGVDYSTFSPSNIYGPGDHFGKESSHFVAALIHKVAITPPGENIELWGSGFPLRQQLYVDDLCEAIPILIAKHHSNEPLIVAPQENLSILAMARILTEQVDKKVNITFNGKTDGQFRKDGDNSKFVKLAGGFYFTPFKEGVKKTYDWYIANRGAHK